MFNKYVSNVPLGSGTNFILCFGEKRKLRARAYLRPEVAGSFNWRIFYINSVNSTFADGKIAYRGRSGGNFTISDARIADGGIIFDGENIVPPDLNAELEYKPLTFDGKPSIEVTPDAHITSDATPLTLPENHYLVFEWTLEGDEIPCTPDSQSEAYTDFGDGFTPAGNCPLPAMFACDRPYKKRIAFIGDSITQGCGTPRNRYAMWAGRIAAMLDDYAVWNLGLGYGRGADCLDSESWLFKTKQNDIVIMTFGVNDLLSGAYKAGRRSSAGEIIAVLEGIIDELKSAGVEVILATVPPFDFSPESYREWRAVNLAIPSIAALHGCRVFDIESSLDATDTLGNKYMYGAHPDSEGGRIAAEKFKKTFFDGSKWLL